MAARPFSNGTEERAWMANWCDRCARDALFRNTGDGRYSCPLLMRYYADPHADIPEWLDQTEPGKPYRLGDNVHCINFKPMGYRGGKEPKPKPPPRGQGQLFDPPSGPLVYVDIADEARPAEVR